MLTEKNALIESAVEECSEKLSHIVGSPVAVSWFVTGQPTSQDVIWLQETICRVCGITWQQIKSRSRKTEKVIPRKLFCWFAYHWLHLKLVSIGKMIEKHHATVINSVCSVNDMLELNDEIYSTPAQVIKKMIRDYEKNKTETEETAMAYHG